MNTYFSKPEFVSLLIQELGDPEARVFNSPGLSIVLSQQKGEPAFALDIWQEAQIAQIDSIGHAVKLLKSQGIFGYHKAFSHQGRGVLIQETLRKVPDFNGIVFPIAPDIAPDVTGIKKLKKWGGFCLLDAHTLLFSKNVWKAIPGGVITFLENKNDPPNRAYLKLWEALTWWGVYPKPGDQCVDFGASPGGWSWVLSTFGAHVLAIDKAPLAPSLQRLTHIESRHVSAFSIKPGSLGALDWFVADIACYPERLLPWIQAWIASHTLKRMICTIKLQGAVDLKVIRAFQEIPHGRVIHLWHNKHELTFLWPATPI